MEAIFTFIGAALSVTIGALTFWFYYLLAARPWYFAPADSPDIVPRWTWKKIAFYGTAMLGTFACVYLGVSNALDWIPHSWRVYDEDGSSRWLGESVAGIIALMVGVFLPSSLADIAVRLTKAERMVEYWKREASKR